MNLYRYTYNERRCKAEEKLGFKVTKCSDELRECLKMKTEELISNQEINESFALVFQKRVTHLSSTYFISISENSQWTLTAN